MQPPAYSIPHVFQTELKTVNINQSPAAQRMRSGLLSPFSAHNHICACVHCTQQKIDARKSKFAKLAEVGEKFAKLTAKGDAAAMSVVTMLVR